MLYARLASELAHTPDWRRARSLAGDAITEARRSGDRAVLAEALMRHFQVTCTPHNLAERRRNTREALVVAAGGHDPVLHFFALSLSASSAIEAAEIDEADAHIAGAFAIGEIDVPALTYNMECIRAWRAAVAGELVDSERLAVSATQIGHQFAIENADMGPALQIAGIRWQLGRFGELLPILGAGPHDDPGPSILRARALACFGETRAEARELLQDAARHDFDDLPLGLHWAGCLIAAAEAAFMLGEPRVGGVVWQLLQPFADQVSFNGVFAVAPVAFGAGLAAGAAGNPAADDLFECALEVCERVRAPILRARTQVGWSRVLVARGGAPDKALDLLRDARETLVAHRVDVIVDSADAVRGQAEEALAVL